MEVKDGWLSVCVVAHVGNALSANARDIEYLWQSVIAPQSFNRRWRIQLFLLYWGHQ